MKVSPDGLREFIVSVLTDESVGMDIATDVADGLLHASLRGVDSHGVRLLPHYLREFRAGRVSGNPDSTLEFSGSAAAVFDADHGFGHWAGMQGTHKAAELAADSGAGIVAVKNSNHFGACSFYSIELANNGMIGISMTHSDSLVVPTHGIRAFLGNNPISIAAPSAEEEPICLDMATSKITFNEVLKRREEGIEAPPQSGVDREGEETTNPEEIEHLIPVGGYKGYGLGVMIEILCAILTEMDFGPHLTKMYDDDIDEKRHLGHLFMAIDLERFTSVDRFEERVQSLVDELRAEPSRGDQSIRVPGDPEKEEKHIRLEEGIPLRDVDIEQFETLAERHSLSMPDPV